MLALEYSGFIVDNKILVQKQQEWVDSASNAWTLVAVNAFLLLFCPIPPPTPSNRKQ